MKSRERLLIIEPWFKESHKALFQGIADHTKLPCDLLSGDASKWRWAMRTGAIHLAEKIQDLNKSPDILLVSDYVHLAALKGLCDRIRSTKTAIYFLENQLTYPTRDGKPNDFEFIAINIQACLAADRVIFCSLHQQNAMIAALPSFFARDSELKRSGIAETIEAKSVVIPIGVDLTRFDYARQRRENRTGKPLRIVWPHRFEHDKNPDDFLDVMTDLAKESLEFELALVGKTYRDIPASMIRAKDVLAKQIVHMGFLSGNAYPAALAASDVVISTAWQETQGIAVIEAIRAGCDPLLPNRLSYPEVLGPALSKKHLYQKKGDLRRRLRWMIRNADVVRGLSDHWGKMERFGWQTVASRFDETLVQLVNSPL